MPDDVGARGGAVLVAGGAGYVGGHCVDALLESGRAVVVADDLSLGHRAAVPPMSPVAAFEQVDIGDAAAMRDVFARHRIAAVMHFAARSNVGESVGDPAAYYGGNVAKTLTLLDAMRSAGVRHLVFSSTAAVFGEAQVLPIDETHPTNPVNPYGASKLMIERILADYARAYGIRYAALRYFNAAGADPQGRRGELHDPETHLIPLLLQTASGRRARFTQFGADYDTEDGTCVRDYVHVCDLAAAHLLALEHIARADESIACNLGNGAGFSVRQVIEMARAVTGREIAVDVAARRDGDPPVLVADSALAKRVLGWKPLFVSLQEIVSHAWAWEKKVAGV